MPINVYHQGRPMNTSSFGTKLKRCDGCGERVAVLEQKNDGKWYCVTCTGGEPLIVLAEDE